jgi:alpha-glucosidase
MENTVEKQAADERSLLQLYRELISLRPRSRSLVEGKYNFLFAHENVLVFLRGGDDKRVLVALNFGNIPAAIKIEEGWEQGKLLLSSYLDQSDELVGNRINLRPLEGLIFESMPADKGSV